MAEISCGLQRQHSRLFSKMAIENDRERNEHAFSRMALVARPFSFTENHAALSTREMRAAPCEINLILICQGNKEENMNIDYRG